MIDSQYWCHLVRVVGRVIYIIEATALALDHEYCASHTMGLCFPWMQQLGQIDAVLGLAL